MSVLVMFERRAILQDDHGRDSLSGVSGHRGRNEYNFVSSEELSADSMSQTGCLRLWISEDSVGQRQLAVFFEIRPRPCSHFRLSLNSCLTPLTYRSRSTLLGVARILPRTTMSAIPAFTRPGF